MVESLESVLSEILPTSEGRQIVAAIRESDTSDCPYEEGHWVSMDPILSQYTEIYERITATVFRSGDNAFKYSIGNLKASYLVDEDFVNGGRAFIIFNVVCSTWVYVYQADNQAPYWKMK